MTEFTKLCTLKIQDAKDRSNMIAILAAAGYVVEIEVIKDKFLYCSEYYVNIYSKQKNEVAK